MGTTDWEDPHGIIPESFRERYADCESAGAALRKAEAGESSTPPSERDRCPYCGSQQTVAKAKKYHSDQRKPGQMKCTRQGCRRHFDEPADETTIFMTDERADAFDWVEPSDTTDPEKRTELDPPFARLDEQTRTALAIALCQPWHDSGASYRDAAAYFPHSHYWIGRRVRAWRDGEHRELVPDPTAADVEPITADESSGPAAVATDGGRRRRWDAYGS